MVKEHKTTYDISNRQEHILKHFFYDLESGQYIYRGPRKDKELVENMLDPKYLNNPHFPKHITKTAIHVLKRSLNALGRNFSDLEAKFDKQVNQLLDKDKIDEKLKDMAYIIKTYKDKYFVLKKKDKRDAAELAMLKDLEDEIIKFSIEYIKVEDQRIEYDQILKHAKRLKENIKSLKYPLESITPEALISIVSNLVKIDDENYALLINATSLEGGPEAIIKAIANKPLLEGDCKTHYSKTFNWKIIII